MASSTSPAGAIYDLVMLKSERLLFGASGHDGMVHMLTNEFQGVAALLIVLAVIVFALLIIKFKTMEVTWDFVIGSAVIAFVYYITFTSDNGFREWIYAPVYGTSVDLTHFILSTFLDVKGITDAFSKLDSGFMRIWDAFTAASEPISFYNPLLWATFIVFGLLMVLYGVVYAAFLGMLLTGIVATHVLMAPGGFILFLAAFKWSRHIFYSWLRAVVTFALVPVFASLAMAFTASFIIGSVEGLANINAGDELYGAGVLFSPEMGFAFLSIILGLILLKLVPDLAASLTGGMASRTGSISGTIAALGGGAMAVLNLTNGMKDAAEGGNPELPSVTPGPETPPSPPDEAQQLLGPSAHAPASTAKQ